MMTLGFLNIGTQEMILIVIAILLLFGGKKLPELARGLGRGIREFKDASEDIKREISDQINNFDKDLDVTTDHKTTSKPAQAAATVVATEVVEDNEAQKIVEADVEAAVAAEKTFPQFTAPEGTFQHDPGAHPVDHDEYYKYGYNDHFASESENSTTEEGVAPEEKQGSSEESETKQA